MAEGKIPIDLKHKLEVKTRPHILQQQLLTTQPLVNIDLVPASS